MSKELESLALRIHELERRTRRLTVLLTALGASIGLILLVGAGSKKEDNITAKSVSTDFISTKTLYVANGSNAQHIDISAFPLGGLEIAFFDAKKQFPPRLSISLAADGPTLSLVRARPKSTGAVVSTWSADSFEFVDGRSHISLDTGDESRIAVSDSAGYESVLGMSMLESPNGTKSITTGASLHFFDKERRVIAAYPPNQ